MLRAIPIIIYAIILFVWFCPSDAQTRQKREIIISQESGETLKGTYAISVCDAEVALPDTVNGDIVSSLLLSSELKGNIEHPEYYFEKSDAKRRHDLDLLLLTQGWRIYEIDSILHNAYPNLTERFEPSQEISGEIQGTTKSAKLIMQDTYNGMQVSFPIPHSDKFRVYNLDFLSGSSFLLQAVTPNNSGRPLLLKIDSPTYPQITLPKEKESMVTVDNRPELQSRLKMQISYNRITNSYEMSEVEVHGKKLSVLNRMKREPDKSIMEGDSLFKKANTMRLLVTKLGLSVQRKEGLQQIAKYVYDDHTTTPSPGYSPVCVVLNDHPVTTEEHDYILNIDPAQIRQMEYFLPSSVDGLGYTNGSFSSLSDDDKDNDGKIDRVGVLMIYTHQTTYARKTLPQSCVRLEQLGYKPPIQFYVPTHEAENNSDFSNGHRVTLYWSPELQLDEQGKASAFFYPSDISNKYLITLEGVSDTGIPLKKQLITE